MNSFQLVLIILLLILIVYYYNKSRTYEKLEHFDDNLINQIASVVNGDTIKLNNVEINGELKVNNIQALNKEKISIKSPFDKLTVPDLTTYNIHSTNGDNSWIDLHSNVHMYKTGYIDSNFEVKGTFMNKGKTYDYNWNKPGSDRGYVVYYPK